MAWIVGQVVGNEYTIERELGKEATKNDHFPAMLINAYTRGFHPQCVAFDSWFSSFANLKLIASYGWTWLTRLKYNRLVNADWTENRPIREVALAETGTVVHLKNYGFIKVFKIVAPDGDIDYWATNDLQMNSLKSLQWEEFEWSIEEYHQGLKQFCGLEKAQVRSDRAQRNHIGLAIRAFLRLEMYWFNTGISWHESKISIMREAVRSYLEAPWLSLPSSVNCVSPVSVELQELFEQDSKTGKGYHVEFDIQEYSGG